MCISCTIKCLILFMHGATMKHQNWVIIFSLINWKMCLLLELLEYVLKTWLDFRKVSYLS